MGAKQSQSKQPQSLQQQAASSSSSLPLFRHAIMLNGLVGSGKSAVQSQLNLSDTRVLEVDNRFLTTPQIYSTYSRSLWNEETADKSVWYYGGRGGSRAKWQAISFSTKALVFTIDATRRDLLLAPKDHKYLPPEFVESYQLKSEKDQAEILATLKKQMYVKGMFGNLIAQVHGKPVLVLLTHADQPDAMTPEEVCEALDLHNLLMYRDWRIASCDALTGEGLADSIDWLNYTISAPTDFYPAQKRKWDAEAKARPQQKPYPKDHWKQQTHVYEILDALSHMSEEERDAKFARGDIFLAPKIYKTNGDVWQLTEEQKKEFVVAPLTVQEEEEIVPDTSALLESIHDQEEEEEEVEVAVLGSEPSKHLDELLHEDNNAQQRERSVSSSSTSSAASDSAASSSSSPASPASETESELSESSDADSTPRMKDRKQPMHQEVLNVKTMEKDNNSNSKSAPRFTSMQSTSFVLPPSSLIPTALFQPVRKHFWSRPKMRETPNQFQSIYPKKDFDWGW